MSKQWKLMEPIQVGKKTLKNRIVLAPMETRLNTPEGGVTQEMIDYYAARAKGGVAAIIAENTFVDKKESRSSLISSGLYSDHLIAGKNLLAEAIQHNGALALLQLSHGGRQAGAGATGLQPLCASPVTCQVMQRLPRAPSIEEIVEIEDAFAAAAGRAQIAGFDGVEIHGAHGYLILSFLSPYTNKRDDEYGGSLENRSRFARNIIKKIRNTVGKNFIVGYRTSGAEFVPGGLTVEEICQFAPMIEPDVDYIHVSAGIYETMALWMITPLYVPQAKIVYLAEAVKKSVKIPVITVGSLDVALGEKALQEGKADIVAFGRALIADPELPNKVAAGNVEDIRPCTRGNEGCISRFFRGCTIRCEVNPACGQEATYKITKTAQPKRVLIAGGGIAGMEAARVADLMGHDVTLMEKSDHLGGHLKEASAPAFKHETANLLNWLVLQVKKSSVKVMLNAEATPEAIAGLKPEVLILAVGSDYQTLPIPGAEKAVRPDQALLNPGTIGKKVVVIGGGLIGAETALTLAEGGKREVTIVEMLESIAPEHEPLSQVALLYYLQEAGVAIHTGYEVKEISGDQVVCKNTAGDTKSFSADTIVMATGLAAKKDAVKKLQNLAPQTISIGDCVEGRKIYDCMHEAWRAVLNI